MYSFLAQEEKVALVEGSQGGRDEGSADLTTQHDYLPPKRMLEDERVNVVAPQPPSVPPTPLGYCSSI